MCRKMDVAIIREKYRSNLWKICCQVEKFLWSLVRDRKNLYRCKRFFFPFENISCEKSLRDGLKKEKYVRPRVVSFAVIYRAIEIPLSTYVQYSQIYLISRLLIFHKSVFIFLSRNDGPCLVWNEYYILLFRARIFFPPSKTSFIIVSNKF